MSGHKNTILIIVVMIIVAAGAGIGVWLAVRGPAEYSGPVEEVAVAAYSGLQCNLIWIAEDQGYFADYGLDVTIDEYNAGRFCLEALLAGEADICTVADSAFVARSFDHDEIRIIGVISQADEMALVARKDAGIEQASDLRGKRIGVTRKTSGEFLLGTFLTFNGLSQDDVEVVDLKPSEMEEAIAGGEIDAAFTWEPYVYDMKNRLEEGAVSWPGQSGQGYYFLLASTAEWLEASPSAAERFLEALVEAERFLAENTSEAKDIVMGRLGYEPSYLESIWDKFDSLVAFPQVLIVIMEDEARWNIRNGLCDVTEVPNYLDLIYLEAMEEVKPEAVSVIR